MRVLLVADARSAHSRRWAEALAARGLAVHVATLREGAPIAGVTMHTLPTFGLGKAGYLLAIPALRGLVRRLAPDAVHAHYVTSYGFLAAAAGAPRLIVTAWGSDVLGAASRRLIPRRLTGIALRRARVVTTVAEHMNASAAQIAGKAITIEAVPFGVDLRAFPFSRQSANDDAVRVTCTRNFHPLYDVESVVRAFAELRRTTPARLTLVGDGPQRAALEALVAELGVGADVTFLGHVDVPTLANELARSDVFVTSAHSDGNNVSLNEAMAVGPFPIATDIPANQQWIDDGVNGLLYTPGDVPALARALARSVELREGWSAVAETNRRIVEQRANWERSVDHAIGLYDRLTREGV